MFVQLCALSARDLVLNEDENRWSNWRSCRKNTACTVVTIIIFVCGCAFWGWLLATLIRYSCLGFPAREAFRCCTSKPDKSAEYSQPLQQPEVHGNRQDPFSFNQAESLQRDYSQEHAYAMDDMAYPQQMDTAYQPVTLYGPERHGDGPVDLGGQKPSKF